MANQQIILTDIQTIFCDIFDDDTLIITMDTTAADIPDWDSFQHINIVIAVEQKFGIKFHLSEIERLQNVGEFIELTLSKLQ